MYPCQCCGFSTLSEPATGTYEICPVCFWEDDPVQNSHPLYEGGANGLSLEQARLKFLRSGGMRDPVLAELPAWFGPETRTDLVLVAIARAILSGTIEALDGCLAITSIARPRAYDGPLGRIKAIASEVDEYPRGAVRSLWAQAALAGKDAEWAVYQQRVRESVLAACRILIAERQP